jgi:hypothetical protein
MAGSHSDELSTGSFEQLLDSPSPILRVTRMRLPALRRLPSSTFASRSFACLPVEVG